jgi:RHS repeat-associated protein
MMPAAKMMDPVMGIDIHIIQPPGPVPPLPIPHPFVGMLFDPMELAPFVGASVFVNGMPKATAGSEGKALPPHIPIGGVFVPPPPGNECEMFMGSATVLFEGEPASYLALPALSCQSIGMPSPPRAKKKPKPILKLPTSVVLPIPAGPPVLIGGPPTISMSVIGMKVAMGALGKAAKKLRRMLKGSQKAKAISKRIHAAAKKAMDKLGVPPSVRNKVHKGICTVTGHPVDVATGKVFTDNVDFELPGPIPLRWERTWFSTSVYRGPLGHGWHHAYDLSLVEEKRAVAVRLPDGRPLGFPRLDKGESFYQRSEKLTLLRDEGGYALRTQDHLLFRFSAEPSVSGEHPLVSLSNLAGDSIRFAYGAQGHLEAIRDSAGRILSVRTDGEGRILRILAPHPEIADQDFPIISYAYDEHSDLVEARDAHGHPWRYAYRNHLLVRETNRNGLNFNFTYDGGDASAKCIRTWGDGGIYDRKLSYDEAKGITTEENSLGHRASYHWQDSGLVTRVINPMGHPSSTRYNAFNEVEAEMDELGLETSYAYDDRGNRIRLQGADGAVLEFRFAHDQVVWARDALGGEWHWDYDAMRRLVQSTDALGRKTGYRYDGARLVGVIDPAGGESVLRYGPSGELRSLTAPDGGESAWEFDRLGHCVASIDPAGNVQRRRFDLLGRITKVEEPDGDVREVEYDPEGNAVRAADRHRKVSFHYQGLNRMASRAENGVTVAFLYDTEESLIGIRNPHGFAYSFELDATGEVAAESGFDGLRKTYLRDAKGRVAILERASGLRTVYRYDAADRVIEALHSDGEKETYGYGADGRLTEAANGSSKVSFRRDAVGQVIEEDQGGHKVESSYDPLGNRVAVASSLGASQRMERDARGEVTRIVLGAQDAPAWEARITRDALGLELERTLPGGVRSKWSRDRLGRPLRHQIATARGFHSRDYAWDVQDRLKSIRDSGRGPTAYAHDPLGNLLWAEGPDGSHLFRVPDAVGNLFRSPDRDDRKYGPAGELLEAHGPKGIVRYAYDPDGNLIGRTEPGEKVWTYGWNAAGMLATVDRPDGQRVEFRYDAVGRRTCKSFQGRTTRWVWDGNNPLHEWVAEEARESPITWLFEPETYSPIAKMAGGECFSILTDHLGTPIAMFDAAGQESWSANIDIHGRMTRLKGGKGACPFRFPGQYEDEETGLYYNRYRYYDPESSLYISRDPLGLSAGIQLHAYVHDPLVWMDPLGLEGDCKSLAKAQRKKLRRIEELAQTPGLSGLNSAVSRREMNQLGKAFVGPGHSIVRGRKGELWYISQDGKRMYREPTAKRSPFARTGKQANFHQRRNTNSDWFDEQSTSNVHVHAD